MNVVELFAGAGGAALGLHRAGFEHRALIEMDPAACDTLRASGLGPVLQMDVRDLEAIERTIYISDDLAWHLAGDRLLDSELENDAWMLERERVAQDIVQRDRVTDLMWASWPCQPWSTAGLSKGAQDDRNGWPWTVAAIDRFEPRWFVGENVRGLLEHRKDGHPDPFQCPRCYFESIILAQLQSRFEHVGWYLIDCADLGLPQHRRRVVLWAGPAPLPAPRLTHCDPKQAKQTMMFGPGLRPWVTMGEALGLSVGDQVIGGGTNPFTRNGVQHPRTFRDLTSEPSTTIAACDIDQNTNGPWVVSRADRPAPTVTTVEWKGSDDMYRPEGEQRRVDKASDALWAMTGRRRLTADECAVLQGLEGHPFKGNQTQIYRQIGNAVPPVLAESIGRAVLQTDRVAAKERN